MVGEAESANRGAWPGRLGVVVVCSAASMVALRASTTLRMSSILNERGCCFFSYTIDIRTATHCPPRVVVHARPPDLLLLSRSDALFSISTVSALHTQGRGLEYFPPRFINQEKIIL